MLNDAIPLPPGTWRHEPLRVVSMEAFPLALPLHKPMRLASETIAVAETLLVRVVDAAGREGWGEASSAPTMTGELLPGMMAAMARFIAPAMLSAPVTTPAEAARRIARAIRGNTGAKAAAEIATLDLFARAADQPLAALLGVPRRDWAPAILMLGEQDPDALLAAAAAGVAAGATHIKLKVGLAENPADDARAISRLRAALGPTIHLAADANMAWTPEAALAFVGRLQPGELDYLEQPVADDDLDGMARVAAQAPCPLCVDEGLHGLGDIAAHATRRAAGGVGLKAIKLGGLLATLAAEALARQFGLRTTLACKIAETSIGAAAAAHCAAVLADVEWGVSVTHRYLAVDVTPTPLAVTQGRLLLPTGAGLGLAPDMACLARHRWRG